VRAGESRCVTGTSGPLARRRGYFDRQVRPWRGCGGEVGVRRHLRTMSHVATGWPASLRQPRDPCWEEPYGLVVAESAGVRHTRRRLRTWRAAGARRPPPRPPGGARGPSAPWRFASHRGGGPRFGTRPRTTRLRRARSPPMIDGYEDLYGCARGGSGLRDRVVRPPHGEGHSAHARITAAMSEPVTVLSSLRRPPTIADRWVQLRPRPASVRDDVDVSARGHPPLARTATRRPCGPHGRHAAWVAAHRARARRRGHVSRWRWRCSLRAMWRPRGCGRHAWATGATEHTGAATTWPTRC
jgi:hypothetical protein